mgnify:CR=1 FL=1
MIHRGTYDGTIYHNPVNRFCIISVKTADKEVPQEARSTRRYKDHLIRFVATGYELPRTDAVELELDGEWTKGKYGVQLQVEQWREIVPKTRDGVEGYLASGLIKGIGPATAAQIVSRFGVETLDILQNHPERLLEVKGILNGSSNYILSRVFDHKDSYANALAQAQALGFAESDPSFDIEGYDSLFKLVIITVHALGTYVAPERIFTYGISTIHDSDIQYAREKNVKIKLVAQVVKVSDEHFTMFVMPEFVTPAKYIYSVDDEYNGVVIRGECYDRQFMFGKGAGSLPTASSILSDIMARLNNYRYEYKKMNYIEKPDYTTDITLKIYARYKETDVQGILNFSKIHEQFISEESNYVIGEIPLRELLEKRSQLSGRDVFLANIPIFFLNRD